MTPVRYSFSIIGPGLLVISDYAGHVSLTRCEKHGIHKRDKCEGDKRDKRDTDSDPMDGLP
jgi:hypothetical protein